MGTPVRVLVGCERSGRVREAFRRRGFDAVSCDLLPAVDGSRDHIQGDVLSVMVAFPWALLVAHPPCTYLSSSGLHWNGRRPGRDDQTAAALAFVVALMGAPIPRIAIENPRGRIGTAVRLSDQVIQPFMFGDDASKETHLWLLGVPRLTIPPRPAWASPRLVCRSCGRVVLERTPRRRCPECYGRCLERWANQTDSGQNKLPPDPDRGAMRAETYPGIAAAMAAEWGPLLTAPPVVTRPIQSAFDWAS